MFFSLAGNILTFHIVKMTLLCGRHAFMVMYYNYECGRTFNTKIDKTL